MEYGFLSVLPIIVSLAMAIITKSVFLALMFGCFTAFPIITGNLFLGFRAILDAFIAVFSDNWNTVMISTTLLVGGLLTVLEKSGGVGGFVKMVTSKRSFIKNRKHAEFFSWIVGILVFTSGTLSTLITGVVSRPLTDAFRVPREKLAYIVHTTSSPVCALLPLSAWGGYLLSLMTANGVDSTNSVPILVKSISLNFYCILALLAVPVFILTKKDFGPMKTIEDQYARGEKLQNIEKSESEEEELKDLKISSGWNMLLPILTMIGTIVGTLFITGNGNIANGDSLSAMLYGNVFAVIVAFILIVGKKVMKYTEFIDTMFLGAGEMLSVALILVFAWTMGGVVKTLGTGEYLLSIFRSFLSPGLLPATIFIASCVISFATGSSWGTMAIMFPIALPMAFGINMSIPLIISSIVGGSVFGDHASPISDTTVMTCFTSKCDPMSHVRTQLPYVVVVAAITFVIYLILGFIM